jgi:hypothetical protein
MTVIDELLSVLGESLESPRLLKILGLMKISASNDMDCPSDDYRAYIEKEEEGFALLFTEAKWFLEQKINHSDDKLYYFTGVFFYSKGLDGYNQFEGELPLRLKFTLIHDDLVQLYGMPNFIREDSGAVEVARWDNIAPYRLHITYSESGLVELISLHTTDRKH